MDPNAPSWNPLGGGNNNNNNSNYQQNFNQQNQYQNYQQPNPQQYQNFQQPNTYQQQSQYQQNYNQQNYNQQYTQQYNQQYNQQNYNQQTGYNQPNQPRYNQGGYNQQQQHQQQQQYSNNYNNGNSNYNNNNTINNNRQQRNTTDDNWRNNQTTKNTDDTQDLINQFGNASLNTQQTQKIQQTQQKEQPSQQQSFQQNQNTIQSNDNTNKNTIQQPTPQNFDDDSDTEKPQQQSQQQGGGGGKKKKKRKRKKKIKTTDDTQQSQQQSPPTQQSPQITAPIQQTSQSQEEESSEQPKDVISENQTETISKTVTEEPSEEIVSSQPKNKLKEEPKQQSKQQEQKPQKPQKQESSSKSSKSSKSKSSKKQKQTKQSKSQIEPSELKENDNHSSNKKDKKKKNKKNKIEVNVHDSREHLNLVLIGHVDAGKSTISGQILLQTGQIDERTIAKYTREAKERNRESWWIAYIMDEDDEERQKGKTVECGRAHFETKDKRYTILDAPGHKNYVPNMISGASQADVALLVISARRGEFDAGFNRGGQTREHALLAFTLGISRVIIVINKMDAADWKKERYDDIEKKVKEFLIQTGFKSKYIDVVPVSGQQGANIKESLDPNVCSWWKGKTLLQTLDGLKKLKRSSGGSVRIPILDRYKGDKGIQAIGKIESGIISIGDTLVVMPTKTSCKISAIAIDDVNVENACAGENVLISFESQKTSLSMDNIFGGCVLCSQNNLSPLVTRFKAQVYLNELPNNSVMTRGYSAVFHCHNVIAKCEILDIPHKINRKNNKRSKRPPAFLRSNEGAIVEIQIEGAAIAIEEYSNFAQLGRFTLRDQGQTVLIGKIETVLDNEGNEQKTEQ